MNFCRHRFALMVSSTFTTIHNSFNDSKSDHKLVKLSQNGAKHGEQRRVSSYNRKDRSQRVRKSHVVESKSPQVDTLWVQVMGSKTTESSSHGGGTFPQIINATTHRLVKIDVLECCQFLFASYLQNSVAWPSSISMLHTSSLQFTLWRLLTQY